MLYLGLSINEVRMRFIALKNINRQLSWLLPFINLSSAHPSLLGHHLSKIGHYLFYDVKTFLHSVLNAATRRTLDQAPPEIEMDPLENVGGKLPSINTQIIVHNHSIKIHINFKCIHVHVCIFKYMCLYPHSKETCAYK